MNRHSFRERAIHGTPAFPVEIYTTHFDNPAPVLAPLHFHKEFEFCVVTEGTLVIQINEHYHTIAKGKGVFINSGVLHAITPADSKESGFVAMLFDADFISRENDIIRNKYLSPVINGEISLSEKLSEEECEIVLNTQKIYTQKKWGFEFEIKTNISKLLSSHMSTVNETTVIQEKKHDIVKLTIEYINKNYTDTISLAGLASNSFVSPEYLCRIFSQMLDMSPIEYLNRYRIMKSADMLLQDNSPISDISLRCGFNNSSYFNKMFMRYIGMTPTQYRKNNR